MAHCDFATCPRAAHRHRSRGPWNRRQRLTSRCTARGKARLWSCARAGWWLRCSPTTAACLVQDPQGRVLVDDGNEGGWTQNTETVGGNPVVVTTLQRTTPSTEHFYGFGERNGALSKRGEHMVFWNTDAYDSAYGGFAPDADPLYLSVPFYIGLRDGVAYGALTDVAHRVEMDVAAVSPTTIRIDARTDAVDQVLVAGPSMAEVLQRYTSLTGRMAMPPRWSLGYHQCRWGYSPASAFEEIGQGFRDRSIPADGLWLDIQHMDGFRTFTWDPVAFPDPAGMISGLESEGFKVTVIADPGIKVDPGWSVYDSGTAGDHFLRLPGGGPVRRNGLAGGCRVSRPHRLFDATVVGRSDRGLGGRGRAGHLARRKRADGLSGERGRQRTKRDPGRRRRG